MRCVRVSLCYSVTVFGTPLLSLAFLFFNLPVHRLRSLKGLQLPSLRLLNVSETPLKSLEGISACPALQSVSAVAAAVEVGCRGEKHARACMCV